MADDSEEGLVVAGEIKGDGGEVRGVVDHLDLAVGGELVEGVEHAGVGGGEFEGGLVEGFLPGEGAGSEGVGLGGGGGGREGGGEEEKWNDEKFAFFFTPMKDML